MDHLSRFAQVAPGEGEALHLAPDHALIDLQMVGQLLRMEQLGEALPPHQFLLPVTQQVAEGLVGLHDPPVVPDFDHAEQRVVEERTIAGFAFAQGLLGAVMVALPGFDLLSHVVEGPAQLSQLAAADTVRDPYLQIALRQAPRGPAQRGNGIYDGALADETGRQQGAPQAGDQDEQVVQQQGVGVPDHVRHGDRCADVDVRGILTLQLQLLIAYEALLSVVADYRQVPLLRLALHLPEILRLDQISHLPEAAPAFTQHDPPVVQDGEAVRFGAGPDQVQPQPVQAQRHAHRARPGAVPVVEGIAEIYGRLPRHPADDVFARGEPAGCHGVFEVAPVRHRNRLGGDRGSPDGALGVDHRYVQIKRVQFQDVGQYALGLGGVLVLDVRQLRQRRHQQLGRIGRMPLLVGKGVADFHDFRDGGRDRLLAHFDAGVHDDPRGRQRHDQSHEEHLRPDGERKKSGHQLGLHGLPGRIRVGDIGRGHGASRRHQSSTS